MGRTLKFLRNRRGAAAAEFALVSLVFAGVLLGILDFNRFLWEYNRLEKACQVGVRFAVMNDMVSIDMATWDGVANGCRIGNIVPENALAQNPVMCGDSSCTLGAHNPDAYQNILDEMSSIYGRLLTDPNAVVEITYENIGMGICGNPEGVDIWPLTTVEISGIQFDFATPLLGAIAPVDLDCRATLTGEDFNTCENGTGASWCP
jgi:hypothetical protein